MASFFFVLIHFVRPKKHEKAKLKFPNELLAEIISFFPLTSKFVDLHVSLGFDLFLFKKLGHYIVYFKKRVYPFRTLLSDLKQCFNNFQFSIGEKSKADLETLNQKLFEFWPKLENLSGRIVNDEFKNTKWLQFYWTFINIAFGPTKQQLRISTSDMFNLYQKVIDAILLVPENEINMGHQVLLLTHRMFQDSLQKLNN